MEQVDFSLGCGYADTLGFAVIIVVVNLAALGLIAFDHFASHGERRDRVR